MYVYNGTESLNEQALYPAGQRGRRGRDARHGAGRRARQHLGVDRLTSNDLAQPGSTSRRLCGSQCFYDLVVATPDGEPDTVYIGGVAIPTFGEPTIRSTDAGATFSGVRHRRRQSAQRATSTCARSSFIRAIRHIAFVGSDGGVVRNDGTFTNISGRCGQLFGSAAHCQTMLGDVPTRLYFLNKGLQTMQFYNIALDPRDRCTDDRRPAGQQHDLARRHGRPAGLEDAVSVRRRHVGVRAFIRRGATCCSRASRATASSRISATAIRRWVRTDDPIATSGERETITASTGRQFITFDSVESGHAVHRVSARLADAEQRRPAGVSRGELPFPAATSSPVVRRLGAARRGVSVRGRDDARVGEPQARRSHERLLRRRSRRRPHRRGRADAGGCRHALGGDELRPAVRLEERERARRRRAVRAHRHGRHAEPLRHAHRRRSRRIRTSRSSRTRASTP